MDIFNENFSLELQIHPKYLEQSVINDGLVKLHDLTGIPLTVSTDAHFIDESYRDTRRIIQAISWHKSSTIRHFPVATVCSLFPFPQACGSFPTVSLPAASVCTPLRCPEV